jgi:hypothetical protein
VTENGQKIITVRLPAELHRRAKVKLAETGQGFQDLLQGFLEEWVQEGGCETPLQAALHGLDRAPEHDLLDTLLSTPKTAAIVRAHLELLSEYIALKKPTKQTKAG